MDEAVVWDEEPECWCCEAGLADGEDGYCGTCDYCGCTADEPRCALPLPTTCYACGQAPIDYEGLCAACYALEVA